jgi:hypothetical protein
MTTEQAEIEAFRTILRTKPTFAGLAGSEFEELLTSYVGQRGAAYLLEAERLHQENFIPLAFDRESIMGRAESEGYIPGLPVPFECELKIANSGIQPVFVPYRHPLYTEEQIKLVSTVSKSVNADTIETIGAQQLWKETKTFIAQGDVFEEIIIGGVDNDGIFTIVEYSVKVDGDLWENRQNFRNADEDSEIYHVYYRVSDELALRFGNGDVGKIPTQGVTIEVEIWHTLGERAFVIADQTLISEVALKDVAGNDANIEFATGNYVRKGQAQESIESVRKHVLSHIQQGPVTARSADYEYIIQKNFPELVYLKVWGEKEQTAEYGDNLDYINKAFFSFLIENEAAISAYATDIIALFDTLIKPMNITPEHELINKNTFQIDIQGRIDRIHVVDDVESDINTLLMAQFGLYKNKNGKLNVSDIYAIIQDTGFFRDTQPHLARKNRPYFKVAMAGTVEASFYDQYVSLSAITFGDDDGGPNLDYVENL